ncbi:retroviral aspartyl protease family, partial [Brachionus plicatilis]
QLNKLKTLIDNYWIVFSRNEEDIGMLADKYGQHDIELNDPKPIKQRPYLIPFAKEQVVKESIQKMLDMNIIQPSNSKIAASGLKVVQIQYQNLHQKFLSYHIQMVFYPKNGG